MSQNDSKQYTFPEYEMNTHLSNIKTKFNTTIFRLQVTVKS